MEKNFNSKYERIGYYYTRYEEAPGWKAKAECLLNWYEAMLYGFGGSADDTEWNLYRECGDELLNYFTEDYTEDDYEWYDAALCAISDTYLIHSRAVKI